MHEPLAPSLSALAVWAAITATVAKNGLGVLWKLILFMGGTVFLIVLALFLPLMKLIQGVGTGKL